MDKVKEAIKKKIDLILMTKPAISITDLTFDIMEVFETAIALKDKEIARLTNNLNAIKFGGVIECPVGSDEDIPKTDD